MNIITHTLARDFPHGPADLAPVHDDEEHDHDLDGGRDSARDYNLGLPVVHILPVNNRHLRVI